MSGTIKGGLKAAKTNKEFYGDDFYTRIGKLGGKARVPKGFAVMDKEKVREAGRKGGTKSRKGGSDFIDEIYEIEDSFLLLDDEVPSRGWFKWLR